MKMISHNIREVDGYKGFAILIIMAFTCFWFPYSYELILPASQTGTDYWLQGLFGAGWVGVDIFMVITGFICTQELLTAPSLRTFFVRRMRRVLPAYYLLLVVWAGVAAAFQSELLRTGDWLAIVSIFTFTSNLVMAAIGDMSLFPPYLQHLWTIALAMQFFLLWAAVVKFSGGGRRLKYICLSLIVVCPAARAIMVFEDETLRLAALVFTPLRLDTFAWGALLALSSERFSSAKWLPAGSAVSLLFLIAFFVLRPGFNQPDPLVLSLGLSLLAVFFATTLGLILPREPREVRSNPATFLLNLPLLGSLGRYSYAIYLYHQPITQILLLWAFLPGPGWMSFFVYAGLCMGVSLLMSMVSFQFWERRFLD